MGKESAISWTDSTWSPWWGCVEASPACDFCYARNLAHRWGFDVWGKEAPRRFFGDKHWNEPRRWNKQAEKLCVRRKVFCASMADVFEDRSDLDPHRDRLWKLIEETTSLDWLLLTKRPALMTRMAPWKTWPDHVWAGTTAEDQKWFDHRWPLLEKVPARIHWLSIEPLLGPIDMGLSKRVGKKPSWAIVGGESGHGARPMKRGWVLDLKEECKRHGVAFFMKQKGAIMAKELGCKDSKGSDISEWPIEFRVQEFPKPLAV